VRISDPIERIIAEALDAARIPYCHHSKGNERPGQLDFALPSGVQIECKQFHAARVVDQMAAHSDVIVIQGRAAALAFAGMIART
jgi:hypothetical protein